MARKKRDYKAEYKRRVQRARKLGYDASVGRGHPRKGIIGIRLAKVLGIEPGTSIDERPKYSSKDFGGVSFEDRLRQAGFKDFIKEARKEVIKREVEPPQKGKQLEFTVTTQQEFLTVVMNAGFTENEAYSLWFSPK